MTNLGECTNCDPQPSQIREVKAHRLELNESRMSAVAKGKVSCLDTNGSGAEGDYRSNIVHVGAYVDVDLMDRSSLHKCANYLYWHSTCPTQRLEGG